MSVCIVRQEDRDHFKKYKKDIYAIFLFLKWQTRRSKTLVEFFFCIKNVIVEGWVSFEGYNTIHFGEKTEMKMCCPFHFYINFFEEAFRVKAMFISVAVYYVVIIRFSLLHYHHHPFYFFWYVGCRCSDARVIFILFIFWWCSPFIFFFHFPPYTQLSS